MDVYFKMLQSYGGRDKVLRMCCFAAMAGSGSLKGESARRLLTIAGQFGEARTVLRLFDGLPMVKNILRQGLLTKEKNAFIRLLSLVSTWSIQMFYPFEALAWAGRYKILPVTNVCRWSALSVAAWAVFLACNILKSLIKISGIQKTKEKLKKQRHLDPSDTSDGKESKQVIDWSIRQLEFEEMTERLSLVQNITDFVNAIHWLPKGFLWSGKLSLAQSGIMGLISTSVMIYSSFLEQPKQSSS